MGRAVRDRGAEAAAAVKIAITGASGFVGSHVLNAFATFQDVEIVATSRSTIAPDDLPKGVRHVALDLTDSSVDVYKKLEGPDVLIHLAWGGLPNYLSLHHFEHELPNQYRFLRAMVEGGLRSLLVTGTCYEYGMVAGELNEDLPPAPANPYAYAKVALHQQLRFLQKSLPFSLIWARLFYMWGPRQAPTSLYPLLQAAIENGDLSFPMSRGEQLRDYLPVEEVARCLASLALTGEGNGIVNICAGQPVSVRALVERWISESGAEIEPELGRFAYPTYEPLAFWGSRVRLDRILSN
jgi:nucleoside-diphosphate-sugar epimerase